MYLFAGSNPNGPPCSPLVLFLPLAGLGPDFLIWSCLSSDAAIGRFSANGVPLRSLLVPFLPSQPAFW